MEKKYEFPDKKNQSEEVREPTLVYGKNKLSPPCVFTEEEKLQQLEQGIKDMEDGLGYSMEEVFSKYKK